MSAHRRQSLTLLGATLVGAAGVLVPAGPAAADPAQGLPDADLFCGSGYTAHVDGFVARPPGASLWIDDPVFGGHYSIIDEIHYVVRGLVYGAVPDPSALQVAEPLKTYGVKTSADDVVVCEVVSRYTNPDVTYIAPLTVVRVSG